MKYLIYLVVCLLCNILCQIHAYTRTGRYYNQQQQPSNDYNQQYNLINSNAPQQPVAGSLSSPYSIPLPSSLKSQTNWSRGYLPEIMTPDTQARNYLTLNNVAMNTHRQPLQTMTSPSLQPLSNTAAIPFPSSLKNNHQSQINESITTQQQNSKRNSLPLSQQIPKSARHIVTSQPTTLPPHTANQEPSASSFRSSIFSIGNICNDRLCYGLPTSCAQSSSPSSAGPNNAIASDIIKSNYEEVLSTDASNKVDSSTCNLLFTSKRLIDPEKPAARDMFFELIAMSMPGKSSYAAVGFSENGRMQGFVSECLHFRSQSSDGTVHHVQLKHSFNLPGYQNVPVNVHSGIKSIGVIHENGYYQCRWSIATSVEFSFEAPNGTIINKREDVGFKNYHILLASGEYDEVRELKGPHTTRVSSMNPVSLAQTGKVKSLGAHILIRIHGSIMIIIWVGMVSLAVFLARYYKNEWSSSRISNLAIWFVAHRALMLMAWFGSIVAVIFAYMYTETYHPGLHQVSGSVCLILSTLQVIGGLLRPSNESEKRSYFNWMHFILGNLGYMCAMVALITASFMPPAHLPYIYTWVMVMFVGAYTMLNVLMTAHQYVLHKSSRISITPMNELNSATPSIPISDYYTKENSPFRQFMFGITMAILILLVVSLVTIVNKDAIL